MRSIPAFFAPILVAGLLAAACSDSTPVAPTEVTQEEITAAGGTATAAAAGGGGEVADLGTPASAGKAKGGKATGGVSALVGNVRVQFQFNAHEKGPKGTASYSEDGTGKFFHGTVNCFNQVAPDLVAFSGLITRTNYVDDGSGEQPAGTPTRHFQAWVYDGGEPGNDDWFRVSPGDTRGFCDGNTWVPPQFPGEVPSGQRWEVIAGNIQVH